jgi:hypothetical protein
MSSVDARSHVYKRLLNINIFRAYTNIIPPMQKKFPKKNISEMYLLIFQRIL